VRDREFDRINAAINEALDSVMSLDADRALRRIAALVGAIQRTNYYQAGADGQVKSYISFKIASGMLAALAGGRQELDVVIVLSGFAIVDRQREGWEVVRPDRARCMPQGFEAKRQGSGRKRVHGVGSYEVQQAK